MALSASGAGPQFLDHGQNILPGVGYPHLFEEIPLCSLIVSDLDAGNKSLATEIKRPLMSRCLACGRFLSRRIVSA